MQGNQACLLNRLVQVFGHRAQDERVAYPMKPVLAQFVAPGCFLVDWIGLHVRRERFVEGGVEERNALDVRELLFA